MKAVLTGSEGFIGKHVKQVLIHMGYHVVCIDNLSNSISDNYFLPKDIINFEFDHVMNGAKIVVHLAAMGSIPRCQKMPNSCYLNNVVGFNNVLSSAIKHEVPLFIYASSSSVLGESTYGNSKAVNELIGKMVNNNSLYKTKTIGLRFFNIFGPGQRWDIDNPAFIPKAIDSIFNNRKLEFYNNGNNTRDFTPVTTVCNVIKALINQGAQIKDNVIDVGMGDPKMVKDIFNQICDIIGIKYKNVEFKDKRLLELEFSKANTEIIRTLGVRLTNDDFLSELEKTVSYYRNKTSV